MTVTESGRGTAAGTNGSIDPARWPDIATVPRSPIRAAIARRLFRRAVARLPLRVVDPRERWSGAGTGTDPVLRLVRPDAFFQRLGATGTIGFGEAYMAGDWTTDDLPGVLSAFAANMRDMIPPALHKLRNAVLSVQPRHHDNTVEGARANIHQHYDLSNDLFTTFLDPSLTYSSALFDGEPTASGEDLTTAQQRKIDRLLDAAAVGEGTRVLEIGTGWGELALRAAGRGAHVTTLTISTEQAELAQQRVDAAGVADRVEIRLQDYREVEGRFDAIVSVEMIEAVGANHWNTYFETIDRVLAPGGRVGLQAILQDDYVVLATKDTYTWIRKYIFPGGQLASVEAIERTLAQHTSLRVSERFSFGRHYAETLHRWRTTFEAHAQAVAAIGFDETFRRMWSLYLAYSEAGFRTGYLDVQQFTLTKQ
ncbi:cyclopropane-fatty-acyl-phospholipid synthase [Jatrophihabitans endophyticus]|uniref:Cyclopropane-fatty-acyl-phospholipid synthase n=1 Tax=Jatrophihabitans endophyticus TaxID=1206085 RepID=A0A1M5CA72_9ACTN|nr:cyclopropane-fatty-acyl-phospholipid synthase family protein [Jatrophihabitans endophyticus]SHF51601.1 cyclopropane-fatty-acyl-phospholipid synthase [Jatrophihabitans endophyticus]